MADTYQEHQECLEFEAREQSDFWFACVDLAVIRDKNLSPRDFKVYCVICSYVNVQTRSWSLRVKTIAEAAGCSVRVVQESLKALIARGVIERTERYRGGKQLPSSYRIVGYRAACYRSKELGTPGDEETGRGAESRTHAENRTHRGAESRTPSLREPKTYEKKDTPTGAAPAETAPEDSDQGTDGELLPVSEAPSAMRSTAEYLLLKTGRKGLDEEELSALRTLDAHHYPARVQREIDKAVERYGRLGRPLRTLSFGYILSSLQHQPSRSPGGGKPPGRKTPKVDYGLDV